MKHDGRLILRPAPRSRSRASHLVVLPRRRRVPRWLPWLLGLLVGVALVLSDAGRIRAHHAQPDVVGAIHAASQRHGVDPLPLIALVHCESRGEAHAAGDARWRDGRFVPTSRGIAQLSDLPTGLARHFWSLGYDDREDPEQAADYLARVYAGHFLPGQPGAPPLHPFGVVSLARWTCWRGLR